MAKGQIMPKEIKYVIFSEEEARQAAVVYYHLLGRSVPVITRCRPVETPQGISMEVRTVATQYEAQPPLSIGPQQTMAALILLCRAKKCPLPKNSMKFLNMVNGRIAMVVLVGMDNPQPLVMGNTIVYADADYVAVHNRIPQAAVNPSRHVQPHSKATTPLPAM